MYFLSFTKNISNNIGKNISKILSGKYSQNLLHHTRQSATDVFKTASKRAIQKSAETNGDLIGNEIADKFTKVFFCFFCSIWVFFHAHSRLAEQQGKGEAVYLTPFYYFHPLHKHLDISQAITAESSPLHIGSSRTRTRNFGLRAQVTNH